MMRSGFESKVLIAFTAAMMVVVALTVAVWKVADDAAQAAHMVANSHDILHNLARTRGHSLQIELATQNFRLTGDVAHLAERDEALAAREGMLESIRHLTIDNPVQQHRWGELRDIINQRMAISRHVEMLRKTQGPEAANAFVATAPLRATRVRTYQLLGEMDQDARVRLAQREATHAQAQKTLVAAGALVAALLAGLLGGTYRLIRRQLRTNETNQRALADNEESLSTTLHSIGDAVLATDTDGRITRMNPVAERLTGWPVELARGRPIDEVFHIINELTRLPAPVPVAAVLATGETQGLANHTVLVAQDGTERPIADSAAPIRSSQGQLRGVVLVFRDVSTEREAERIIQQQNALLAADVQQRTAQWHESESHLHSVIGNVPALIAYVDAQRRYVYVNDPYRERFAPGRGDITGCTVQDILGDERYAIASPLIGLALEGKPQNYDWEPFPGVWQTIQYIPRRQADGTVVGYYVLGTDITERKHFEEHIQSLNAELAQRVQELERVSRALRTLSAGNRAMLRAGEEQGLLQSMCQAIVASGGYGMAIVWYRGEGPDATLRPMAECGFPGGLAALRTIEFGSTTEQPPPLGATSGLSCPLRAGNDIIGALSIYDPAPGIFGEDEVQLLTESADDLAFGIATLRARAEQARVQAAMHHLMRHDALTRLPNAIEFTEALTAAVEGPSPAHPMVALQLNIERLGEINDVLGYTRGDELLQAFGQRLRDSVPDTALVARLRGDEFAVLAPAPDEAAALAFAETLETRLSRPFPIADIELDVTAQTGIALYPQHGATAQDILRRMGKALNLAKVRGLSRCLFDPTQQQEQIERLNMAGELRRAIGTGQLRLFLQPKVAMDFGAVCGAEALVRWQHPSRGLIPPGLFIGLAEQTGLIKPLTEWVIVAVLDLLQAWQAKGCALPIAVNLSARNFRDDQLFSKYQGWLAERGVPRGLLEVEITESTVMDDAEYALHVLHALHQDGITLYVDDFGTGYSSLSYLQKLPVDYIKIDQSFVAAMSEDRDSAIIVRSTIDLVHDLGCKTVAEGVETQAHWTQLAALGCDIAQGYFIARPMPADEFLHWQADFRPLPPGSP